MANIQNIVAELKQERDRLSQAINALESIGENARTAGRMTGGKRTVSALARRRMAQAQRARWAKVKSQSKPATKVTPIRRTISAAGLARIRAAQRARWAKVRAGR